MTPLARAIDCGAIGFEEFLALEFDVALDCLLGERYLEEFTWVKGGIGRFGIGLGGRRASFWQCGWLSTTLRGHTFHVADVTFGDAGVVEILQAFDTEDVRAEEEAMACRAFLGF